MLMISSIERSLDNIIYESYPRHANFEDLPFDGDEGLIARQLIYGINSDIFFRLNNVFRVYV